MGAIRKHLTREQIGLLCELHVAGVSQSAIANMLSISKRTIWVMIQKHYKPKYKNPIIMVLDSKV